MSDSVAAAPAAAPVADTSAAPVETSSPEQNLASDGDVVDQALGLTDDTSAADIDAAQKAGEITKKEAQSLKKQLKIKVDGVEETVDLDFNDEEGLKRHIQKAKAFDKRAKEYSTLQNQVDALLAEFENDPAAVMQKLGKDPEKFAEEFLTRKIKEMEKSPEQKEQEKLQKELEELRAEKKKATERAEQMEMEKLRNQYATQIENEISEALDVSKSTLPKGNPRIMKRIAQTMLSVMDKYPDVKIADVIPVVEKEWKEELGSYFDSSAEERIEELVGKHNFERMRKKRLANRPAAPKTKASDIKDTGNSAPSEKPAQKVSMKKFFRGL